MAEFKPQTRYDTAAQLLKPEIVLVNGVRQRVNWVEGPEFRCRARSFGGSETVINGVYAVQDTMSVETWYHPEITGGCRIRLLDDGSVWEILATPENILRRGQRLTFRARRVIGEV